MKVHKDQDKLTTLNESADRHREPKTWPHLWRVYKLQYGTISVAFVKMWTIYRWTFLPSVFHNALTGWYIPWGWTFSGNQKKENLLQ